MGFGPGGLGGTTTALGLNIEVYPTHIAGMPVAVSYTQLDVYKRQPIQWI